MKIRETFPVWAPYIRKSRLLCSSIPTAVSKRLHIDEQVQVEEHKKQEEAKREIHHIIHWRRYTECLLSICYWEHI